MHVALLARGISPYLVHTGQHYDWEMSAVFLRDLGLPDPDVELDVGSASHVQQTAQVMLRLEPVLSERRSDVVVVVGDVNSTLGAALAAVKLGVPVAHVEAGLRSRDRTMPEEINRLVTDTVSDALFAPSRDAVDNLRAEGTTEKRIFLVGNAMIDSLERILPRAVRSQALARLAVRPGAYFVATVHRPSNVDNPSDLARVVDVLHEAGRRLPVLLVAHPRTARRLEEARSGQGLPPSDRVRILPPLGYVEFLGLVRSAAGVLTDSGGIQEETTVLGVPCLTLRENTERPITVTEGTNEVVGLNREVVKDRVDLILDGRWKRGQRPDLWDGHAGERIADVLVNRYRRSAAGTT